MRQNLLRTSYYAASDAVNRALANTKEIVTTIDSKVPSLDTSIGTALQQLFTDQLDPGLRNRLKSLSENFTDFLEFAEEGKFGADNHIDPIILTNALFTTFNSYLASQALAKSNIYGTVGNSTNVVALATNGTQLAYPIQCSSLDAEDVCDAWYYSNDYRSSFGLVSHAQPSTNYGPLLSKLFALGYVTGDRLFKPPFPCNTYDFHDPGSRNFTITPTGLDTTCLSYLDVYTWDMFCHLDPSASDVSSEECEFLEGPAQEGFWKPKGKVPAAYLGPLISQNKFKISRS